MRTSLTSAGLISAAAASLVLGLAACGAGSSADEPPTDRQADTVEVVEEQPGDGAPPATIAAGEGDYAFGLGRDSIAEAISTTFASADAAARWEGDTLVVTMDGDADGPRAGWTECRVVTEMVEEGDSVAIVYPNGRLECAEVLEP